MPLRHALRVLRHSSLWLYRAAFYVLIASVLLVAVLVLGLRYWVLPNIDDHRLAIAAAISRAANQRITIGSIQGEWDGLRPRLILQDVRLYDRTGVERLALESVDSTVSWASLVAGEPRFYSIEVTHLSLEVRRDVHGTLIVAGFPLAENNQGEGGLADWLLEQRRIVLRDTDLTWIDEALGGEPLVLKDMEFRVDKLFTRHRFGLRAVPPLEVASPIDLRGDVSGSTFAEFKGWHGQLYLQVGYADLAALRKWFPLPLQVSNGVGGMRVWMNFAEGRVRNLTADAELSGVQLRLQPDLPELELTQVQGRLIWKEGRTGMELAVENLAFATPDNLMLPPADIRYRRSGSEAGPGARFEVEFDALDLAAVARLMDRLPIDGLVRAKLEEMHPRGTLRGFTVSWQDHWDIHGKYTVRGSFEDLTLSPSGYMPGFSLVSGAVNADQEGGTLTLRAAAAQLDMPQVFIAPLPLDSLSAKLAWSMDKGSPLVRLEYLAFTNPNVAGNVAGSYKVVPGQPGNMDISGRLERMDGRVGWRYVPLVVNPNVREWMQAAIVSGTTHDVQFRLRGDLRQFPFRDGKGGVFEVIADVEELTVAFAPGWPRLEGMKGEIAFRGERMTATVREGSMMGVRLAAMTATIPDLESRDALLQVRGEAEGPTAEFLRTLEQSPVDRMVNGFTHGMLATGGGRLSLSLDLPLNHTDDAQVSGQYRFVDNTLDTGPGTPLLRQLGGQLVFTRDDVSVRDGSASVFGMPVRFTLDRDAGGVRIRATGRAEATTLRHHIATPLMSYVSGATDWKGSMTLVGRRADLVLESDLRGLSSSLPAPLSKAAGAVLPFKLERKARSADQDLVGFTLGTLISGQLLVDKADGGRIVRGEVKTGDSAALPQRDGLWFAGKLDYLDFDQWRRVLSPPTASKDESLAALAGVQLRVSELHALSRTWNEVGFEATLDDRTWKAIINSREAVGNLSWSPGGEGVLTARFSKLQIPASTPEIGAVSPTGDGRGLPALDVVADDFSLNGRPFGKLTLAAVPQGRDWRIEQVQLRSLDGTLTLNGVWEAWSVNPSTRLNAKAEVTDIGRYFNQLKLPQGIKGGSGHMEGQLAWSGPPYSLDLPSLSGTLSLETKKGQFVKIEPGIGKLIGVLSLQALPRRATFDFHDLFSEGFAFDQISASAVIDRGVIRTDNFRMVGPAARVEMKGDLNLVAETQTLDVKIIPAMSESVALGAAIVNPVVGLATLLAQKALKDPIGQMVAFNYEVKGTWADPTVTKKKRNQAQDGKQGRK
jgi:uncharacterized protein (TIGR02099 family)